MSEEEIKCATVLRDIEDKLEERRLKLVNSIKEVLSYFEEKEKAKQRREEQLLLYFSYSMLITWGIIMAVLVVLFL